jgi:hypothetical protein
MLTFTEWGDRVQAALPQFEDFAARYNMHINVEATVRLLGEGEYQTVWTILRLVCEGLPDDPSSYGGEYTVLCQLCELYPHEETH